jgi:cytoskeletal protein CcmA (bactofilin family)
MADEQEKSGKKAGSVIAADIVITGSIEAPSGLLLEGRVNGEVRCADLVLGEKSVVTGGIHADRVRVEGVAEGGIEARDVSITATGHVMGNVFYERVNIALGGTVEGNMKRRALDNEDNGRLKLVEG